MRTRPNMRLANTNVLAKNVHITPQGPGRNIAFSVSAEIILPPGSKGTDVIKYIVSMKDEVDKKASLSLSNAHITSEGYVSVEGRQQNTFALNYTILVEDKDIKYSSLREFETLDNIEGAFKSAGWKVK